MVKNIKVDVDPYPRHFTISVCLNSAVTECSTASNKINFQFLSVLTRAEGL